jgi:outer membrane immunogenic protein
MFTVIFLIFAGAFKMKRLLIGISAAASLFATGALAADMAVKQPVYTKAPVYVEPVFNWTGFYVGGNLGYSWGRSSDTSTATNGAGTTLVTATGRSNLDGIVGGGQIGYNWQMANWVWGLEADIQGTDEKGSRSFICPAVTCLPPAALALPDVNATLSQKIDWFGTVRGRAGILAAPQVLLYATGGLAYGEIKTGETVGLLNTFSTSTTNVGWTVGAGVEGVIGGGWTAKLEYLYVDLGHVSGSFVTTLNALGNTPLSVNYNSHITDNIVRAGVNYHFGGPVVAKY